MKLNEILSDSFNAAEWEAKGYELPKYEGHRFYHRKPQGG